MANVDWDDEYLDDPEAGYDDGDTLSETLPCPECGEEVYEDAEQCPACGNYITRRSQLSPLWRWTAIILLACLAYWVWLSLRNLP